MPYDDQTAFYIRLDVQPQHGHCYVSSQQVPGLHLVGKCFQDMKSELDRAITRLFRDNHRQDVRVVWMADAISFPKVESLLEMVAIYPLAKAA